MSEKKTKRPRRTAAAAAAAAAETQRELAAAAANRSAKAAAAPVNGTFGRHEYVPEIQLMSQVLQEKVAWMVPDWIAYSNVTLIGGPTSVGKSTLLAGIVSHSCGGSPLHAGWPVHWGRAIWYGHEESAGLHIRPRLEVCGVPLHSVMRGGYDSAGAMTHMLSLPRDLQLLRDTIECHRLSLVVIDPISSFLSDGVDPSIPRDVRPVIEGLTIVARETGASICMTLHDRKDPSGPTIGHFAGAGAWTQVPRVVLRLGYHPRDQGVYVLTCEKGSLAGIPQSRTYELISTGGPPRMTVGDVCDLRPDDLAVVRPRGAERDTLSDAKAFLLAELADGEKKTTDLQYSAAQAGLAWHGAVRTAKDMLAIECFQRHQLGTRWWVWRLPEAPVQPTT